MLNPRVRTWAFARAKYLSARAITRRCRASSARLSRQVENALVEYTVFIRCVNFDIFTRLALTSLTQSTQSSNGADSDRRRHRRTILSSACRRRLSSTTVSAHVLKALVTDADAARRKYLSARASVFLCHLSVTQLSLHRANAADAYTTRILCTNFASITRAPRVSCVQSIQSLNGAASCSFRHRVTILRSAARCLTSRPTDWLHVANARDAARFTSRARHRPALAASTFPRLDSDVKSTHRVHAAMAVPLRRRWTHREIFNRFVATVSRHSRQSLKGTESRRRCHRAHTLRKLYLARLASCVDSIQRLNARESSRRDARRMNLSMTTSARLDEIERSLDSNHESFHRANAP